jgi:hypothetical protein
MQNSFRSRFKRPGSHGWTQWQEPAVMSLVKSYAAFFCRGGRYRIEVGAECFFISIIDAAIRARAVGEAQHTRAIVIYPMNMLANIQMNELETFIDQSELPDQLRPTFARYTGQESADEREGNPQGEARYPAHKLHNV